MPTRTVATWKELVLGVLILGTLAGFLVLIVHHLRELSHRVECQHRLQRIGLAMLAHHENRGVFPGEGGYGNESESLVIRGVGDEGQPMRLGLGVPYATPETQSGSWLYQILPYLNNDRLAQTRGSRGGGSDLVIQKVLCPSRGRPELLDTPATDPLLAGVSYESNPPGLMRWGRTDYAGNGRLLAKRGAAMVCICNTEPGLANAILIGEKALDVRAYATGGWLLDGPALVGGPTCVRNGTSITRDACAALTLDSPVRSGWGAAHYRGAHFLFAAGQVRLIQHDLSETTLKRLLGPSEGVGDLN